MIFELTTTDVTRINGGACNCQARYCEVHADCNSSCSCCDGNTFYRIWCPYNAGISSHASDCRDMIANVSTQLGSNTRLEYIGCYAQSDYICGQKF